VSRPAVGFGRLGAGALHVPSRSGQPGVLAAGRLRHTPQDARRGGRLSRPTRISCPAWTIAGVGPGATPTAGLPSSVDTVRRAAPTRRGARRGSKLLCSATRVYHPSLEPIVTSTALARKEAHHGRAVGSSWVVSGPAAATRTCDTLLAALESAASGTAETAPHVWCNFDEGRRAYVLPTSRWLLPGCRSTVLISFRLPRCPWQLTVNRDAGYPHSHPIIDGAVVQEGSRAALERRARNPRDVLGERSPRPIGQHLVGRE
jgi:hypothetical protein